MMRFGWAPQTQRRRASAEDEGGAFGPGELRSGVARAGPQGRRRLQRRSSTAARQRLVEEEDARVARTVIIVALPPAAPAALFSSPSLLG